MRKNIFDAFLIAVLFVLSLVDNAFSNCRTFSNWADCSNYYNGCTKVVGGSGNRTYCQFGASCSGSELCSKLTYCDVSCPGTWQYDNKYFASTAPVNEGSDECTNANATCTSTMVINSAVCGASVVCTSQCEADSVAGCPDGTSWNSDSCACISQCNDSIPEPDRCQMSWNKGYAYDANGEPGGGGYWQIEIYECSYDSCAMSHNCSLKSHFPAGSLTCDDLDSLPDPFNCIASIGHRCTISCPNNKTISCDCDGSCAAAKTMSGCQCPPENSSSSQGQSSSSQSEESSSSQDEQSSSSSQGQSSSSNQGQSSSSQFNYSSSSPKDTSSNGDWEYDYSGVLNRIDNNTQQTASNTNSINNKLDDISQDLNITAGYLSSIDKWQSIINLNQETQANAIKGALDGVASEAASAASAASATKDTLHHTNEILEGISGTLNDSVDFDTSGVHTWKDSVLDQIDSIKSKMSNYDTLSTDSLKGDTSTYKTKYSKLFLSGAYSTTVNSCYEFRIKKPEETSSGFGKGMKEIYVNFGNLANTFDLCAIARAFIRACGAILCLLIMVVSYRSAFGGGVT